MEKANGMPQRCPQVYKGIKKGPSQAGQLITNTRDADRYAYAHDHNTFEQPGLNDGRG